MIVVISCGYSETEEDKFPDMAVFPEIDSDDFSLKKSNIDFSYVFDTDLGFMAISNDYRHDNQVIRLDKNFNKLDSVGLWRKFLVVPEGLIYKHSDSGGVEVHDFKTNASIKLQLPPFFDKNFYLSMMDGLKNEYNFDFTTDGLPESYKDSLELITQKYLKEEVISNIKSIYSLVDYHDMISYKDRNDYSGNYKNLDDNKLIIKTYENEEYYLPRKLDGYLYFNENYYDFYSLLGEIPIYECTDLFYKRVDSTVFKKTDRALIKNESYGNHFTFGFSPGYMHYYKVNWNGKEVTFKYYDHEIIALQSYDEDKLVLEEYRKGWYILEEK